MAKGDLTTKARNILLTTNKYQDRIILLTLLPSVLMFGLFIAIIFIANPWISEAAFHTSFLDLERFIHQFPWLIGSLMFLVLTASMIGAYLISVKMVGAVERIICELDEIIAGRSQKNISSRPNDDLSRDLLQRINVLVSFYVENKDKK